MNSSEIRKILKPGFLYFLGIFALGFVLGTVRTLVLVPRIGALYGVLLEIPIMLSVSWFFSRRLILRYSVQTDRKSLLAFGLWAFFLLISTETVFALSVFGQSPAEYLAGLQTLPGALGLSAQFLFGLIPALHREQGFKSE